MADAQDHNSPNARRDDLPCRPPTHAPAGAPKMKAENVDFYYGEFHALKNINI